VYNGVDRSRDFDLAWLVESYPYDGILAVNAIIDLMLQGDKDLPVTKLSELLGSR
jgi:hypothetical protein